MFGELTDKETIERIDQVLEAQLHDQFEILLYKKNSKYLRRFSYEHIHFFIHIIYIIARFLLSSSLNYAYVYDDMNHSFFEFKYKRVI